jgi:hypothetical protein
MDRGTENRRTNGQMDGWMDGWTNGRMEGQTDRQSLMKPNAVDKLELYIMNKQIC